MLQMFVGIDNESRWDEFPLSLWRGTSDEFQLDSTNQVNSSCIVTPSVYPLSTTETLLSGHSRCFKTSLFYRSHKRFNVHKTFCSDLVN